jgi:hypothetical protein
LKNFSCVDKKGILSWPNPTAEKMWIFNNIPHEHKATNINSRANDSPEHLGSQNCANSVSNANKEASDHNESSLVEKKLFQNKEKSFLETFNLTHDKLNGFELKFDDANWSKSINALKPIVEMDFLSFLAIYISNV